MSKTQYGWSDGAAPHRTVRGQFWLWLITAFALASVSFLHASARAGLRLPGLDALEPVFSEWRVGLSRLEVRAMNGSASPRQIEQLRAKALRVVRSEPLAVPAWRAMARADVQMRRTAHARLEMQAIDRLSRRDVGVQGWLIEDAIRSGNVASTLRHFDAVARIRPQARTAALTRLAQVLPNPAARRDLVAYVSADTPWFTEFAGIVVNRRGSVAPFADLLIAARQLPDGPNERAIYAGVIARLAREGEFDRLRRLYPRLPGAIASDLQSLSFTQIDEPLYPPVGWVLTDEVDHGATLLDSERSDRGALEGSAEPLITGTVARRLVWPADDSARLSWRVTTREGARDASALIGLRCLDAVAQSGNLFDRNTSTSITVPQACPVAMVELRIFGGNGRDPSAIVIEDLAFDTAGATR